MINKQALMLCEKFSHQESRNGHASRGFLLKLARTINKKYHSGFNDSQFCKQHGIYTK